MSTTQLEAFEGSSLQGMLDAGGEVFCKNSWHQVSTVKQLVTSAPPRSYGECLDYRFYATNHHRGLSRGQAGSNLCSGVVFSAVAPYIRSSCAFCWEMLV